VHQHVLAHRYRRTGTVIQYCSNPQVRPYNKNKWIVPKCMNFRNICCKSRQINVRQYFWDTKFHNNTVTANFCGMRGFPASFFAIKILP
jgi:hypothetical protein